MGFRDSNQDVLGFVHLIPDRARQRILDLAATQLSDGTCFHQYQPLTKKGNADIGGGFYDDHLWLIVSTCAYVKETGDASILQEPIGYADLPGSSETLLHHLETSVAMTLRNRGEHGLPLIGHADWNDCLNLNSFTTDPDESFQTAGDIEGSKAESVMIAGLFLYAVRELAALYAHLGRIADEARLFQAYDELLAAVEAEAWDGEWYLRAFDAAGEPVGTHVAEEGPHLRREPELVRARRRGSRERPGEAGARERAEAPRDRPTASRSTGRRSPGTGPSSARSRAIRPATRRTARSSVIRIRGSPSPGACSAKATARSSRTSRSVPRRRTTGSTRTATSRTCTRRRSRGRTRRRPARRRTPG